ncbi:MAG: BFD-like (2Fe-2S) binding domain protein [Alphaproteobacteria bacterium ADurb.BinA280]|nr:MAG: BFD-like (2Fe-2S) binding domain protein [Alphaproteobacteria bacterium ADurb.BinA280]
MPVVRRGFQHAEGSVCDLMSRRFLRGRIVAEYTGAATVQQAQLTCVRICDAIALADTRSALNVESRCLSMYICICHGVTESAIAEAAAAGVSDLNALTARTGCGSSCGCCRESAEETLALAIYQLQPAAA